MLIENFNFERMNETDVRENVIAPLLRELGYRHSSSNDVITEQSLRYPKQFLGRKKSADPDLRGRADYILEVDRRLRWVAEVKAPSVTIGADERDQAWTYAAHPEIKAIYYLVTNGRTIEVHRTVDGPAVAPLLTLQYEQLGEKFHLLANIVSPEALKRDYREFVLDTGMPLGAGLRSFAKVVNGALTYTSCTPKIPGLSLVGLVNHIQEGTVERSEEKIFAYLKISSGRREIDEFNHSLGLGIFDVATDDRVISSDPSKPTTFLRALNWTLPHGSRLPNPTGGAAMIFPRDVVVESKTAARGVLSGLEFSGAFDLFMTLSLLPGVPIHTTGEFKVWLS